MEVTVIRSKRKSIAVQIKPDGPIVVRAPKWMKERDIESFVLEKRMWIEKHSAMIRERQARLEQVEPYTEAELRAWTKQAREIITQKVRYYAPLVGVDYGKIAIRRQRSRWGSCSSKGNLNVNCLLVLLPELQELTDRGNFVTGRASGDIPELPEILGKLAETSEKLERISSVIEKFEQEYRT